MGQIPCHPAPGAPYGSRNLAVGEQLQLILPLLPCHQIFKSRTAGLGPSQAISACRDLALAGSVLHPVLGPGTGSRSWADLALLV